MKLTELKAAVYQLAQVSTTKQLKKQHTFIKPLDMRFKASWEKVLVQLQSDGTHADDKRSDTTLQKQFTENSKGSTHSYEEWVSNPPSEYQALFTEADEALEAFDEKLLKTKKLTKTAIAMAHSLDEFAEASLDEAKRLAKAGQIAQDNAKEADLN